MRILLFGSSGQVGWELQRALQPLGDVVAFSRAEADFAKPESLRACFAGGADVVVNAVAYTAVDAAETAVDDATRVNVDAVRVLAEECARHAALLVHYSTDYVFDGTSEVPYREDDATAPMSVYGRTKRDGEDAIRASACAHLILRTSWVFASRGKNFVRTILRLAAERDVLRIVGDQVGAPTSARLIADVTAQVLRQALEARAAGAFASATLHLVAGGSTTWHGLAAHIVARARESAMAADLEVRDVEAIATQDYPVPARRPASSLLDTGLLRARYGVALPDWRVGVDLCLDELLASR